MSDPKDQEPNAIYRHSRPGTTVTAQPADAGRDQRPQEPEWMTPPSDEVVAQLQQVNPGWRPRGRRNRHNGHAMPLSAPSGSNPAYVKVAVEGELASLATTPSGGRNSALNDVALRCARLLPRDPATREDLRRRLIDACERNGLNADDGVHDTEATIDSAFRKADSDDPAPVPEPKVPEPKVEIVDELPDSEPFTPPAGDTLATPSGAGDDEPTTWEPHDLGPHLRGEVRRPTPTIGIRRADGLRFIYAAREHAVVGETESGKTWFALCCVAAELVAGHHVLYVHYEEGDATSTVERLQLLGVADAVIAEQFRFVAPTRPVQPDWLAALLDPPVTLVIHDGVNEAMSLIGAETKDVDGVAQFRRRLIRPCILAGAATLACDHMPMVRDGTRRDAYGSVHKGNALDGARISLENAEPFGRGMRGASHVFVTKDRPGHLRAKGRASRTVPGKTFMGTFVVDDSRTFEPFETAFYAPRDDEAPATDEASKLADDICRVIDAQPDHTVGSLRALYAHMRDAGHQFTEKHVRDTVDDLLVAERLAEVPGKRNATGFRTTAAATAAEADES